MIAIGRRRTVEPVPHALRGVQQPVGVLDDPLDVGATFGRVSEALKGGIAEGRAVLVTDRVAGRASTQNCSVGGCERARWLSPWRV